MRSEFPEPEFRWGEMFRESKLLVEFFALFRGNKKALILWAAIVVVFFSFWDTMAVTFQPLFLQKISGYSGLLRALSGVIMASFLIPILLFQMPFAALADRFGRAKFVVLGILVSGTAKSIGMIFFAGLANSVGYALAFVPAQAMLAVEIEQSERASSEKSAGVLRVALNVGNVFGQFLGGLVFAAIGFSAGFFVFGAVLLVFAIFSFVFLLRR